MKTVVLACGLAATIWDASALWGDTTLWSDAVVYGE